MKHILFIVLFFLLLSFNNLFSMGDNESPERSENINQQYYRYDPMNREDEYNSLIFAPPTSENKAKRLSQNAVEDIILKHVISNNPDTLYIKEIMEFDNDFYIKIGEKNSDYLAFELTVDPIYGYIKPEPGPNVLWNTKYGYHNLSRWFSFSYKNMDLTEKQAIEIASKYLESYMPESQLENKAEKFHGYYTINVKKDNKLIGIMSVNGFTGEVWYHNQNNNTFHKK